MSPDYAVMTLMIRRCSHTAPIPLKILEITSLPIPPLPVCAIATSRKMKNIIKLHFSEMSLSDGDLYTVCKRVCVDTPNSNSQTNSNFCPQTLFYIKANELIPLYCRQSQYHRGTDDKSSHYITEITLVKL